MIEKKKYDKKSRLNLKVIIALARCIRDIHKKVVPLIKRAGLTISQFGVLEFLYHKGPNNIGEIIKKNLSTGGNMTVVIDNLEKLKYVRREMDPDDRRAILIHLTKKGEKLISGLFPHHLHDLNKIMEVITSKEKEDLIKITKKLSSKTGK